MSRDTEVIVGFGLQFKLKPIEQEVKSVVCSCDEYHRAPSKFCPNCGDEFTLKTSTIQERPDITNILGEDVYERISIHLAEDGETYYFYEKVANLAPHKVYMVNPSADLANWDSLFTARHQNDIQKIYDAAQYALSPTILFIHSYQ